MKSFNTELSKHAEKIRLRAAERRELRDRILTYMEYHPLPKDMRATSETLPTTRFGFARTLYARAAVGVFAALLIIVSVPIAAEHAVPGDVLYPIKTQINESIRAQFVNSPYEKVAFETELMERRIAEARLLAKEGNLSEEDEAKIAESVKSQADAVQKSIANLKESDADEAAIAAITFGSALEVQSALFASSTDQENSIADAVRNAKVVADAEKGTTTPSYERLVARVDESIIRAHELSETVDGSATDEEKAQIERRLKDIERKVETAKSEHANNGQEKGVTLLIEALADTQKLISFMTDIDVRESITLDTLLPVVLTLEERMTDAKARFSTLEATWSAASSTDEMATSSDETSEETPFVIAQALTGIPPLIEQASSTLAAEDLSGTEELLTAVEALLFEAETFEANMQKEAASSTSPRIGE